MQKDCADLILERARTTANIFYSMRTKKVNGLGVFFKVHVNLRSILWIGLPVRFNYTLQHYRLENLCSGKKKLSCLTAVRLPVHYDFNMDSWSWLSQVSMVILYL